MISNIDKTSIFDRVMEKTWYRSKKYMHDLVCRLNMLHGTAYDESDFICEKLKKYEAYYVYFCDPHDDKLIIYLSDGEYSFANHFSCRCKCCHNVRYVLYGFFIKYKKTYIMQMNLREGYNNFMILAKHIRLLKEIGNNISKDIINYIVMDYAESDHEEEIACSPGAISHASDKEDEEDEDEEDEEDEEDDEEDEEDEEDAYSPGAIRLTIDEKNVVYHL